ncbi:uncharacterized protein PGTG_15467 [Puccinia graminis f. sp. tritici CRL 75-36-700-3]|uniref:Secreted protein n=1 Tax=Puccinia graminis f. sp. tritici (strain CRL 75-36-700-3 / race SCCL) TaxID=418459 RepID=E3KY97_PUCGT|nr:uncharacterized protein PGTG_15467 [Puccinia graminis f. sp. tritici CRL 75-36-700-3]EFP89288.2 hypothetical protein PGTG_15467 [Puccinia graminis f. sp. tritici CRL 75-36-700-3]
MQARKTMLSFILVVSALAGLASAAPSSAMAADGEGNNYSHAVLRARRNESPASDGEKKTPNAIHQLACEDAAKAGTPAPGDAPKTPNAVHQLACDGSKPVADPNATAGGVDPTKPTN